jgi:hypothetical protein
MSEIRDIVRRLQESDQAAELTENLTDDPARGRTQTT